MAVIPPAANLMRFTAQKQAVEQHHGDANTNGAVGQVERRPMPVSYMEIEKIDDGAMANPVDHVADRAPDNQADRNREQRGRNPA